MLNSYFIRLIKVNYYACCISSLFIVFAARRIMTISLVSDITLKSSQVVCD